MGAPYTQTHGFRQDRERFFDVLERLIVAIERLTDSVKGGNDATGQDHPDAHGDNQTD